ncbi:MAG: hypothetical protein ACOX6I_07195 [Syntrophomonadaceae bacterium]
MACVCEQSQQEQPKCNTRIDYSNIVLEGDRRLPFLVTLDTANSILNPLPGQNQRFCYTLTGIGQDTQEFIDLSHWVLSICPDITLDQIVPDSVTVVIGGIPQTVVIGENVELFIPPDTDPPSGCSGLKFDFDLDKVLDDQNSVG